MNHRELDIHSRTTNETCGEDDAEQVHPGHSVASMSKRSVPTSKPTSMGTSHPPTVNGDSQLTGATLGRPTTLSYTNQLKRQNGLQYVLSKPTRAWNGTFPTFRFPLNPWQGVAEGTSYPTSASPKSLDSSNNFSPPNPCGNASFAHDISASPSLSQNGRPLVEEGEKRLDCSSSKRTGLPYNPAGQLRSKTPLLYPSFSNLSPVDSEFNREMIFAPNTFGSMESCPKSLHPQLNETTLGPNTPGMTVTCGRSRVPQMSAPALLPPVYLNYEPKRSDSNPSRLARKKIWKRLGTRTQLRDNRESSQSDASGVTGSESEGEMGEDREGDHDDGEEEAKEEKEKGSKWTTFKDEALSMFNNATVGLPSPYQENTRHATGASPFRTNQNYPFARGQSLRDTTRTCLELRSTSGLSTDKRFACPYSKCGRAFARNYNLQSHIRSHLGIREFVCPECEKKFSRKHDCMRHRIAIHHYARNLKSFRDE